MHSVIENYSLSTKEFTQYLGEHQDLLTHPEWDVLERLWLFQLDLEGFIVAKKKYPPEFLQKLYIKEVDYVSLKDQAEFYFVILKTYLNRFPEKMQYTSQLRPDF